MRKILQIIPAQQGITAHFTYTDGKVFTEPVICWALSEWYEDEGVSTDVVPLVVDPLHRNSLVVIYDIRDLKKLSLLTAFSVESEA